MQEVHLSLAGRSWTLRPTFRLIAAVEQATDRGCYALGLRIASGEAKLSEIAAALHAALRATAPDAPRLDEIGAALLEEGAAGVLAPLGDLLLRAFVGGRAWREQGAPAGEGTAATAADPPDRPTSSR